MQYGIEFHSVKTDLGQEEQECHETDDGPELSVGGRTVAELVLQSSFASGIRLGSLVVIGGGSHPPPTTSQIELLRVTQKRKSTSPCADSERPFRA
jgi:hypothetical protein